MEVLKIKNKNAAGKAIETIEKGGVVVCPTDTVYGFLADAANEKAVEKIYGIKKRPRSKPLPVFVKDIKMAKDLAEINEAQEKIINGKWPGKYTFILNRKNEKKLYGINEDTIALRLPQYKFLNDLLKKMNKPLVQTSVNISGQPALEKIKEIIDVFNNRKNRPDLIIDAGDLLKNKSSSIIDLTKNIINIIRK
jgi:L-threonylcarbamoyladenylate synthase